MSAKQNDEDCDETTAIKRSYSQELGSSQGHLYNSSTGGLSKRYIVAIMSFFGFGKKNCVLKTVTAHI